MTISADSAAAQKARTAEQNESTRQVPELAALRRMLIASEGTFSLSFAVYNVVRLRDELLRTLTGEYPGVESVRLLQSTNRLTEAELLIRRALAIDKQAYGAGHPHVANRLNNLAQLLQATNRLAEAEPLMRRALAIDEQAYGAEHSCVAIDLNNLAQVLKAKAEDAGKQHDWDSRARLLAEAESLSRRCFEILLKFTAATGHHHPQLRSAVDNYAALLQALGHSDAEVHQVLNDLGSRYGVSLDYQGSR